MANVMISIPNQQWVHKLVMLECYRLIMQHRGHDIHLNLRSGKPIDSLRNEMIKEFLDHTSHEYLLFMDSDNPPVDQGNGSNLLDLVDSEFDVVAFPTPMRFSSHVYDGGPLICWNIFQDDMHGETWNEWAGDRTKGLVEIDAAGSGALLIKRQVLEHPEMRPWFMREWDADGIQVRGSDLLFCRKAKRLGFRIAADWRRPCHHFKTMDLLDVWRTVRDRDPNAVTPENINTPEYWDGQWQQRGERILPFYPRIVELLEGCRTVLDYGCGRGDLVKLLGEAGYQVEGQDISEVACGLVREAGYHARHGDRIIGQYDAIVATEVLEHIDDDAGKLREMLEHAPLVIFSVPNDCLPPGMEPEHRHLYNHQAISRLPGVIEVEAHKQYLVAKATRQALEGNGVPLEGAVGPAEAS